MPLGMGDCQGAQFETAWLCEAVPSLVIALFALVEAVESQTAETLFQPLQRLAVHCFLDRVKAGRAK
jgi:hypothetical protein